MVILFIPVVVAIYITLFGRSGSPPTLPNMADGWWGRGLEKNAKNLSVIKPFAIDVRITDLVVSIYNSFIYFIYF